MRHLLFVRRLFVNPERALPCVYAMLDRFGEHALSRTYDVGIRITVIAPYETYRSFSPTLQRLQTDIDAWPVPPAGLFIVDERMLLLRSQNGMTIAHEFGHAVDCMLGGGLGYHSQRNRALNEAFRTATAWVTPYAATRIDEYFAEGIRAYLEANDTSSPWPRVSRMRLRRLDPALFAYIDALFANEFRLS